MQWFRCDAATGAVITGGDVNPVDAANQTAGEGQVIVVVGDGLVANSYGPDGAAYDFSALKAYLQQQINETFTAFVGPRVSSDVAMHDAFVSEKRAEALSWVAGDEAAHPERYPFMLGELAQKQALGLATTMQAIHDGIMAQVAEGAVLPALEGYRVARRALVGEAVTLPAIDAAGQVDWAAVLANLQSPAS